MEFGRSRIDLHIHSTISDGTDTPQEILGKAKAAHLSVFSVTDHDAIRAAHIIPPLLAEGDPCFVTGIEFSCKDDEGKYHVLGYGFDPASGSMTAISTRTHNMRMDKMQRRLDILREHHGLTFSDEDIHALMSLNNPGKPHLANLMIRYGYVKTKEEAMSSFLNHMKTGTPYVSPGEAIESIINGGGIPVLAHPFFGNGDESIFGEEMERRLSRLVSLGIQGIEAYYSSFTADMTQTALALADKYGLYVTAGSDYHGTNKTVLLADTGLSPDTAQYPDALVRFIKKVTKKSIADLA